MGDCCDPQGYHETFGARFARRTSRRYLRRGPDRTQGRLIRFLEERGLEGATVLEIGGGVGEIQVELLRRGARTATNLEISPGYEAEAARLLERTGLAGRVTRRLLDIATAPDQVAAADVVVLHRVVCCYPDYERLLGAAARHADRLLVFSHPASNGWTRAAIAGENLLRRLRGIPFRAFVHPPPAMVAVAESAGMTATYRHTGPTWNVVGLERS